jgi:hypothetical protein
MAVTWQFANTPLPSDIPVVNYGVTDIPAFTAVVIDTTNYIQSATANDGIGVKLPTTNSASQYCCGVLMETAKAGGTAARMRTQGLVKCVASGAVTVGQAVNIEDASGHEGQVETLDTGDPMMGLAVSTAADGEDVLILLQLCGKGQ